MKSIEWNESMSVGNAQLDDQHKLLLSLIERAKDALESGNTDMYSSLVAETEELGKKHFETEERHMLAMGYDGLSAHKGHHDTLREQMVIFSTLKPSDENIDDLFFFLGTWIHNHVMNEDMKYRDWELEHGKK